MRVRHRAGERREVEGGGRGRKKREGMVRDLKKGERG